MERDARGRIVKGSSLNPLGKQAGTVSITTALKRRLRERPELADELVDTLLDLFRAGHPSAISEVMKRVDGLVPQRLDVQRVTAVEVPMSELYDDLCPTEDSWE